MSLLCFSQFYFFGPLSGGLGVNHTDIYGGKRSWLLYPNFSVPTFGIETEGHYTASPRKALAFMAGRDSASIDKSSSPVVGNPTTIHPVAHCWSSTELWVPARHCLVHIIGSQSSQVKRRLRVTRKNFDRILKGLLPSGGPVSGPWTREQAT